MAVTLTLEGARQTYYAVTPSGTDWTLSIGYCLCLCRGGGSAEGALQDVLVGRQEQMLHTTLSAGHPLPTPQAVAALIRQDCQAHFGAAPGQVWIEHQQL